MPIAATLLFFITVNIFLPCRQVSAGPTPDISQPRSEMESDSSEKNQLHEKYRLQVHLPPLIVDHRNEGDYFRGQTKDPELDVPDPYFDPIVINREPEPWTLETILNRLQMIQPRIQELAQRQRKKKEILNIWIAPEVLSAEPNQQKKVALEIEESLRLGLIYYGIGVHVEIGYCPPHSSELQVLVPRFTPKGWAAPWRLEILGLDTDLAPIESGNVWMPMILEGLAFPYKSIRVDSRRYTELHQVPPEEFQRLVSEIFI